MQKPDSTNIVTTGRYRWFYAIVRRPVATIMLLTAMTMLGVISYKQLPVQLVPNITLPQIFISLVRPGFSVDEMEKEIIRPIEAIVSQTPRVEKIVSNARNNSGSINLTLEFGSDVRFVQLDLQEKIAQFGNTLEEGQFESNVQVASSDFIQSLLMWVAVNGPDEEADITQIATDRIVPIIGAVDGVATVQAGGGALDSVDVVFDLDRLEHYRVPLPLAASRLQQAVTTNFFLGAIKGTSDTHYVVMRNRFQSADQLRNTIVDTAGIVRLSDVADVVQEARDQNQVFHIDGRNSVGMTITKESTANPLEVAREVKKAIEEIQKTLPEGYTITIPFNTAELLETVLDSMQEAALLGAALAMMVLVVFLRRIRMSLIVFVAIPVSIISTFSFMMLADMSINMLSLMGLVLGVGLLLDNSIVVLENIFRVRERGQDPMRAASIGTGEVFAALMATVCCNIVVFVPILFAEGALRIIFREGAFAIIFPQVVALLVAMTLTPVLTARALSDSAVPPPGKLSKWSGGLRAWWRRIHPYWPAWRRRPRRMNRELYGIVVRGVLRHRLRTMLIVTLVIVLTAQICIPRIQLGVIQTQAQGTEFPIYVDVPNGAKMEDLERAVKAVEDTVVGMSDVKGTRTWGNLDSGAQIFVTLKPENERERSFEKVRATVLDEIGPTPGAMVSLESSSPEEREGLNLLYGGAIQIYGADEDSIKDVASNLSDQLSQIADIARVEIASQRGADELHYQLDVEKAALMQVSPQDAANMIQSTRTGGEFQRMYMEEGEKRTEIFTRIEKKDKTYNFNDIQNLVVLSQRNSASAPSLKDVGRFRIEGGERQIHRENLQRMLSLNYFLRPQANAEKAHAAVNEKVEQSTKWLPAGITAKVGGQREQAEENLQQVVWMLNVTFLLIFMTLAAIFESLLTPLVVMTTLPLAGLGVLWVMAFGGVPADELAMFGVLILGGIVVNNGIVMLDFMRVMQRERGYRRTRAVLEACYSRLRPILMTTMTTVLGVMPMALKKSEEFQWASLAIVIMAGMLSSTVLTLLVVPAVYMNIEDAYAWWLRGAKRTFAILLWPFRATGRLFRAPVAAFSGLLARPFRRQVALLGPSLDDAIGPLPMGPESRPEWPGRLGGGTYDPADALDKTGVEETIRISGAALAAAMAKAAASAPPPAAPPVVIRQVCKVYPVFRLKKLIHFLPSRTYKFGARPPEGIDALRNVSFTFSGGMCGLLGPNGAGKTTLMQIMTGLLEPSRGHVAIAGVAMASKPDEARRRVGYLPQRFGLPGELEARDFLDYQALIMGMRDPRERRMRIEQTLEMVNLSDRATSKIGSFSGGMKQRVAIARLLLKLPDVLIVDEPTAGLDPIERVKFRNLLAALSRDRCVIFSTHILEDISSSCRELAVMNFGRLAYFGSLKGLAERVRGKVWLLDALPGDAESLGQKGHVLQHRMRGEKVQYRLLSHTRPIPGAAHAEPTLEDGYMATVLNF